MGHLYHGYVTNNQRIDIFPPKSYFVSIDIVNCKPIFSYRSGAYWKWPAFWRLLKFDLKGYVSKMYDIMGEAEERKSSNYICMV